MHAQSVVKKLAMAIGIINKLSYYVPISILKCAYFSFVYSNLRFGVSTWGNSAAKCINKITLLKLSLKLLFAKLSFFLSTMN